MNKNFRTFFILGALITISPLSIDMYLPAFQQIATLFGTTVPKISLSLSSYFIGLAFGQLFYGPFLDRYGRKPPLYFGLILYIVASVCCILARNAEFLIGLRLLQALGGCSAQVACLSMVGDFYPVEKRTVVLSRLMLILSVSPLFAPTLGGIIAATLGWQTIFLTLGGVALLTLLSVAYLLPEGHAPDPTISLNPKDIFKEFIGIIRNPFFITFALAGAFSFSGLFAYLAASSSIFMGTFGLNAKEFGLIFALLSIGMVGGGQFNIWLNRWFVSEKIFRGALTLQIVVGLIFLAGSLFNLYGLTAHIFLLYVTISCVGLTYPNAAALALEPFEKNRGSASAALGFMQMGMGALGSAGFGVLKFQPSISLGIIFVIVSGLGIISSKVFQIPARERPL